MRITEEDIKRNILNIDKTMEEYAEKWKIHKSQADILEEMIMTMEFSRDELRKILNDFKDLITKCAFTKRRINDCFLSKQRLQGDLEVMKKGFYV